MVYKGITSLKHAGASQISLKAFMCTKNEKKLSKLPYFEEEKITGAISDEVIPVLSLQTANNKEILQYNKTQVAKKFQMHELDTGSTPVQSKRNRKIV